MKVRMAVGRCCCGVPQEEQDLVLLARYPFGFSWVRYEWESLTLDPIENNSPSGLFLGSIFSIGDVTTLSSLPESPPFQAQLIPYGNYTSFVMNLTGYAVGTFSNPGFPPYVDAPQLLNIYLLNDTTQQARPTNTPRSSLVGPIPWDLTQIAFDADGERIVTPDLATLINQVMTPAYDELSAKFHFYFEVVSPRQATLNPLGRTIGRTQFGDPRPYVQATYLPL